MAFDERRSERLSLQELDMDIAYHRSRIDAVAARHARALTATQRALESRQRIAAQARVFEAPRWRKAGGIIWYPPIEPDTNFGGEWGLGYEKGTLEKDEVESKMHPIPEPTSLSIRAEFAPDAVAVAIHSLYYPSRKKRTRTRPGRSFFASGWFRNFWRVSTRMNVQERRKA